VWARSAVGSDRAAPTKFMVVSTQRSGSTWVVDLLNSHPDIVCHGALFLPRTSMTPAGARGVNRFATYVAEQDAHRYKVPLLAWRFLDELYAPDGSGRAVGFKFMYSQFRRHPWVLAYARVRRIRVVHLVRRNKLEHLLSKESATARGQFHAHQGDDVSTPPIHLDTVSLVERLTREEAKVRRARRTLAMLRVPVTEVGYEEIASDQRRLGEVLRFLGVDPRPEILRSSLQRWSRGTHEERIVNYDDVRATLEGTRFAELLC
jgi:LPS sulfotransferase NodH